jgi:hypothetical protein
MTLTFEANTLRQFMKRIEEIRKEWETKKDGKAGYLVSRIAEI